jgi:integration host factor subunit alpha
MVFSTLKEVLHSGDKVKISGFGNFVVREKNERVGRNPQTGAEMKIQAKNVVRFKAGAKLTAAANPVKPAKGKKK